MALFHTDKLFLHFLTLTIILSSRLPSQELRGMVIQKDTKLPLASVNVLLKDTKYGTTTDTLGQFEIKSFPIGMYVIEIRRVGYKINRYILNAQMDEQITLLIELELDPILMEAVEITSEAEKSRQLSNLGKTIITSEQIKRTGTKSLSSFLKSKYPGVFPSYSRAQYSNLRFVLYVNGALVQYSGDVLDTMFDVEEIDYIEVYRSFGATPTKSRGSNERVIHIHTKIPEFRR